MSEQDEQLTIAVFQFIRAFMNEKGFSPTLREIGESCFMSASNTGIHLGRLEGWGWITRVYKVPRSIGISPDAPDEVAIKKLLEKLREREAKKRRLKRKGQAIL